jgi:ATP-dependent DNA helicase RecG
MDKVNNISDILRLGEGQSIEFKESPAKLDKEIVAFANAVGGTIYCGVSDRGEVIGTNVSNSVRSQIQDTARNCDPPVEISIRVLPNKVLVIDVPESHQKPHQCSGGFYLRMGANSQKLKTSEVLTLIGRGQTFFDSKPNATARYPEDLYRQALEQYGRACDITVPKNPQDLLHNLQVICYDAHKKSTRFTNAGVILLTKNPGFFIPECYITVVRYAGVDKFKISDRKDFKGPILEQIESALLFAKQHIEVEYNISEQAPRVELRKYPLVSIREALINSLVHRDYTFTGSCTYFSIYADRIEIENPGGLLGNFTPDNIEGKSLRRNPLLADLLFRAGFGEKLGSGLTRIREALTENHNPPYQIAATNFFSLKLLPRMQRLNDSIFTSRQLEILSLLQVNKRLWSSSEIASHVGASTTTITREVKSLLQAGLVVKSGVGKSLRYRSF